MEQVRVIYLAEMEPKTYYKFMAEAGGPKMYTRFAALIKIIGPLRQLRG